MTPVFCYRDLKFSPYLWTARSTFFLSEDRKWIAKQIPKTLFEHYHRIEQLRIQHSIRAVPSGTNLILGEDAFWISAYRDNHLKTSMYGSAMVLSAWRSLRELHRNSITITDPKPSNFIFCSHTHRSWIIDLESWVLPGVRPRNFLYTPAYASKRLHWLGSIRGDCHAFARSFWPLASETKNILAKMARPNALCIDRTIAQMDLLSTLLA